MCMCCVYWEILCESFYDLATLMRFYIAFKSLEEKLVKKKEEKSINLGIEDDKLPDFETQPIKFLSFILRKGKEHP